MADMIPVGNTGTNPLQSLASLISAKSGMIGIQQQQQALQTGQYQQAAVQAQSQQEQQKNQELQALAQFTSNAVKDPKYQLEDGSPDIAKFQQDASVVAPVYGQPHIGQLTSNFKEAVGARQALQNLSSDQNAMISKGLQGLANIPGGATRTDVLNWKEQLEANNNDPKFKRAIDNATLSMTPDASGGYSGGAAKLAASMSGASMQAPGQIDKGGQVQPTAVTTMGPGIGQQAPAGAPITKTLSPAEQLPHQTMTNAGIVNVSPGGALSAPPQNKAPNAPNLNPSVPQGTGANALATTDSERYSQVSQEGTNATTGAQLADQVSQLADQVRTGKLSKEWADKLAVLRQHDPSVTDRQMLSKYAAQLKTMATQGATTDASRSQIDEGMPSPETMDPDATKQAAQYVGGIFRMRGARQTHADQYLKNNNGSPLGLQGADDAYMRAADPTVFAYRALPPGAARQQFAKEHGLTDPAKAQEFAGRLNQINHYGGQ